MQQPNKAVGGTPLARLSSVKSASSETHSVRLDTAVPDSGNFYIARPKPLNPNKFPILNKAAKKPLGKDTNMSNNESSEVWADRFLKLPISDIIDTAVQRGVWPFPKNTLWRDFGNSTNGYDNIVDDPRKVVKDVEEIAVLCSVPKEVVERLETEHKTITGKHMAWTVAIAVACAWNPRVYWCGDPAGGAILFAQTRKPDGTDGGLATAVFPTTKEDWKRYANATNFESEQWNKTEFPQTDSHPVVSVSYIDAQGYLKWLNAGLPAEREIGIPSEPDWLHAATQGDGRTYPWGEQDPTGAIGEELLQWSGHTQKQGTSSVHAHWRGFSASFLQDMAGNTWEWTSTVQSS